MSHKCNILYIESGTSGGGSFQSLYQHLRVINKNNFHPVVVYLNNNRYIESVKSLGITVHLLSDWLYKKKIATYRELILHRLTGLFEKYIPIFYLPFFRAAHKPLLHSLKQIVLKEKIHLIHLNTQIKRDIFGVIAAEQLKLPCISHLRSMRSGSFDKYSAEFVNQHVSQFIANSNMTKQYWKDKGIDGEKIKVVYNAINEEPIQPEDIRKKWGIDETIQYIIGCVGTFTEGKGQGFLLDTFARLLKNRSDVSLLLVGDGQLRDTLYQRTLDLGISKHVIFTGYLSKVDGVIAGCDVLVLPSQTESFGRVLLEAMMAGTPIIATNTGGVPEIIDHEQNGLLVTYDDEEGLMMAVEQILSDENLCTKLIENGYQTLRRFGMDRYESDLAHIYTTVIDDYEDEQ